MAIIKCKMCGGDLEIIEGSSVCECTYCGTKQTVPSADNEKKLTLFARAGRLLRACEFDKASGVFETILADFPEEAEAYWGLVLCKYGIEYVDDPATGKKIPTCHRSSFDSVLKDANFELACENTDAVARRVYRDEARQIEELRKSIIEVSDKEEPYDVFISYKETDGDGERTLDSVIAQDIYKELTGESYRVFFSRISLEDKLGTEYEPYIFAALNSAKVMIVVGTGYENFNAVWVKNEWSRFLKLIAKGEKKTLIPVFKNMDAYDMPEEFNKLTALDMGKVGAMQDLVHGVEKIVGKKKREPISVQPPTYISNEADAKTAAAVKRGRLALEESEWSRARDYFEQALTLDAECAEAYFGMALAENECSSVEHYINRATAQTPEQRTLTIPPAAEHIQDIAERYKIPNFLSTGEIKSYYNAFNPTYSSSAEGEKAIFEKEKKSFESNRNISLAFRFAKGKYREVINGVKNTLFSALEEKVRRAEQEEHEAAKQKEGKYQEFLQKKDLEVEELYQKRLAERENVYLGLCKELEDANETYQCRRLKERFQFLGEYKDCNEYVKKCEARIAELEEMERKEQLERSRASQYASYSALCSNNTTVTLENLETAKLGFKSLGDYRDASSCAQKCAERIEQIKKAEEAKARAAAEEAERQRLLAEREVAKKKAKRKKLGIIVGILAVIAVAAFMIAKMVIIPANAFKSAVKLYESRDYIEAYSTLTQKCPQKALRFYAEKAAAGETEAMFRLGMLYLDGLGVEKNEIEAVSWFTKAADAGDVNAINKLGEMYYNGNGVTENNSTSTEWFMKAAEAGNAEAMRNVGVLYETGQKDYKTALEWYLKAANAGDATAMLYAAYCYDEGKGVAQDFETALEWYLKAANAGNTNAMLHIGRLYYKGNGVEQSYKIAAEWFEKAAEAGDPYGMHLIGLMYAEGLGVEKNEAKANEWAQKAKAAGYQD